jgi:hypothetical protein
MVKRVRVDMTKTVTRVLSSAPHVPHGRVDSAVREREAGERTLALLLRC